MPSKNQTKGASQSKKLDLTKFSAFLLAVGVFLIGVAAIGFYVEMKRVTGHENYGYKPEPFWARCEGNAVIVSANSNLSNVKTEASGKVICSFENVLKGNDVVCYLNGSFANTTVFLVRADGKQKAVVCYQREVRVPVAE